MASLLGEIKRRKVFQVAAVYAVVAWLLVEITATVEEPLSLPGWADTLVIVLVVIGFPLALILSWVFDMTPRGIIRTTESSATNETVSGANESAPQVQDEPKREILPNSVAVLPFENLSPNADDAYFAAGIHEELLNQLAKIRDLRVIARTSVMQYEGARRPVSEIAGELRVGTLMEGSVRYAGSRVRVAAQLIDAATEDHLWSEVYERDLADVFAIQADIATQIATALKAEFSPAEQQRVERPLTRSPEAHARYLQAMAAEQQGGIEWVITSPEVRTRIQSLLDDAIAVDPDFALAHVQRARVHTGSLLFDIGSEENFAEHRAELENLALQDLEKALTLDPNLGAAYAALARIHQYNWRAAEAEAAYERAIQLRPNDPEVLCDAAMFKSSTDRLEEAIDLGRRALALDPGSARANIWVALIYLTAHDYAAAEPAYRSAAELAPTQSFPHACLALLESASGNAAAAVREAKIAEQLLVDNTNPAHLSVAIYVYGLIGLREDAKRLFARLEQTAATRRVAAGARAQGYLGVGDNEQALYWLKRAAETREPYEGYFSILGLKANQFSDPVLDQPEFVEVRSRLGFRE